MRVSVSKVDRVDLNKILARASSVNLDDQGKTILDNCMRMTSSMWAGLVSGEFVCAWGLIPPTILSDRAYLWLYTKESIEPHEFLFIRYSQIAIQEML